jgi:outer membrane protein TolC
MAETAAGSVGLMTGVSQKIPFPGKLSTRARIAEQDMAIARQDLESMRLAVVRDTRNAYWSYYYSTRALDVIESDRDLLSRFQQIAEAKYSSGTATQQDVLRASVELSDLENQVVTLRQRRTTAAAMLNTMMDLPVTAALPEPAESTLEKVDLELEQLLAQAAQSSPQLRRIHEQIQRSREEMQLAHLQRFPDLTVGFNYSAVDGSGLAPSANGDDQWWVGFGINLPIWKRKLDAAEREAELGLEQGVASLAAEENRVAFRVQDALVRVDTKERLVVLFSDVIIPQARQVVDASASGYRAGGVDFLTLIDNWRKLLDFELMRHQSLAELEQELADLEQVVGAALGRKSQAPPPAPPPTPMSPQEDPEEPTHE